MKVQIDVKKIIDKNPQIDGEVLRKTQEILRGLVENGVQRSGYGLETPESKKELRHSQEIAQSLCGASLRNVR